MGSLGPDAGGIPAVWRQAHFISSHASSGWGDSQYQKGKVTYPSLPGDGCKSSANYFLSNHSQETFNVSCPPKHRASSLALEWLLERYEMTIYVDKGHRAIGLAVLYCISYTAAFRWLFFFFFSIWQCVHWAHLNFQELICQKSLHFSRWVWLLEIHLVVTFFIGIKIRISPRTEMKVWIVFSPWTLATVLSFF